MKKPSKSSKTRQDKSKSEPLAKNRRKNSNASTRGEGRQRSGSNNPQQGSH